MVFFGDVNKQHTLVFGDANESTVFLVMLIDSRYVVMQMNWPFFGDRCVTITLLSDVNESDCILLAM
jgi:hypothetical protein